MTDIINYLKSIDEYTEEAVQRVVDAVAEAEAYGDEEIKLNVDDMKMLIAYLDELEATKLI